MAEISKVNLPSTQPCVSRANMQICVRKEASLGLLRGVIEILCLGCSLFIYLLWETGFCWLLSITKWRPFENSRRQLENLPQKHVVSAINHHSTGVGNHWENIWGGKRQEKDTATSVRTTDLLWIQYYLIWTRSAKQHVLLTETSAITPSLIRLPPNTKEWFTYKKVADFDIKILLLFSIVCGHLFEAKSNTWHEAVI